ncbi:MAG: hypothetical protein K6C13_06800 [Oscillospiraceae bacterium]|nr:hypothetical protein [Oscillospiraceae bacterium]
MTKKKSKTRIKHPILLVLSVILMLISLAVTLYGTYITRLVTDDHLALNEMTPETAYSGAMTDGLIFAANGTYGQTYQLDKNGNIIEGAPMNYYYLVPVNDNYCITIYTSDPEFVRTLEALTAATENFSTGKTETIDMQSRYFNGVLYPLTEDEISHLYSWILTNGLFNAADATEASKYIIPYKAISVDINEGLPYLIGGSIGFLVFAVLILLLVRQRVKRDKDDDDDIDDDEDDNEDEDDDDDNDDDDDLDEDKD